MNQPTVVTEAVCGEAISILENAQAFLVRRYGWSHVDAIRLLTEKIGDVEDFRTALQILNPKPRRRRFLFWNAS